MKKVLIVYHYIALYRQPVFKLLHDSNVFDFYFASDTESNNNIELVCNSFYESSKFIKLNNTWLTNSVLYQSNLIKTILEGNFSAVIFLGDPHFLSTWIATAVCRIKKIKVLYWTHAIIRDKGLLDLIKINFYKMSDAILLYGEKSKIKLIENNVVPKSKAFVIYNSLDFETHSFYRLKNKKTDKVKLFSSLFLKPDIPCLLFIGRLTVQKKLDVLIDLLESLKPKGYELNLLFIGDGSEKESLVTKAKHSSVCDSIAFYGKCYSEDELSKLIMCSDVCISPGEVGLTAIHCLSYGIPVITHNSYTNQMPEYESVIDNVTGYLYDYDSFESLQSCVELFLNSKVDFEKNCLEIIKEKYNPLVQKEIIEDALHEILG